jgi:Pectate lyase superfamily protein/Periplasmic copper-binding protein (NosD)
MELNSIAVLKATNGTSLNQYCKLLGYYTPGDGGGGEFYWDPASVDPQNGITVIQAISITGRWKRIFSKVIDIKWCGAKGDGTTDNLTVCQNAIDFTSTNGYTLLLSAGTYLCNGTLWLKSNTQILGVAAGSVLKIGASGSIRGEKGGVRNFGFNNNYANEVIPTNSEDYTNVIITNDVPAGASTIGLNATAQIGIGDVVYTYNGIDNAWAILSDAQQSAEWNNYNNPLAQMEIFVVNAKTANSVTLNRPTLFDYPSGGSLRKLIGVANVELNNFTIEFVTETDNSILLEQMRNSVLNNLHILNGGINLVNRCVWNQITNCVISTRLSRCILIDAFGSANKVLNNTCYYATGGDAAILVMMSNNNIISNNTVEGSGHSALDEIGFCCHARCYSNVFGNNIAKNMAEGYGMYYGCWANTFNANISNQCFVDYSVYYSGKGIISNAFGYGSSAIREGQGRNKRSVSLFGSRDVTISGCSLEKNLLVQVSKNFSIENNTLYGDITLIAPDLTGTSPLIKNNKIISTGRCISIQIPTYIINPPYKPILIEGNYLEGNNDKIIYIERAVHVYIRSNSIKANNKIGIGFNDVASFTEITNNHFMDCSIAIDFSAYVNNVSTSYANVNGNKFSNCTSLYQSWISPVTNTFIKSGGICGFEIFDLSAVNPIAPVKKWVFTANTDGLTGTANWKELTV